MQLLPATYTSATRAQAISNMRSSLERLQSELVTGRHADIQERLGTRLNSSYSLRVELGMIDTYKTNTANTASALDFVENAFSAIQNDMSNIKELLISSKAGVAQPDELRKTAEAALESLPELLAARSGAMNFLAGDQLDKWPLAAYRQEPISGAAIAFEASFMTATGVPYSTGALAGLQPADIDAVFSSYTPNGITDADWTLNWTQGEVNPRTIVIDRGQLVELPTVNSNDALRKLAGTLVMLAELTADNLPPDAFQQLVDNATSQIGEAEKLLTGLRAQAGAIQKNLDQNVNRLETRRVDIYQKIGGIESIDPYAASIELNELQVNLELAYKLTSRLQSMFLGNYL